MIGNWCLTVRTQINVKIRTGNTKKNDEFIESEETDPVDGFLYYGDSRNILENSLENDRLRRRDRDAAKVSIRFAEPLSLRNPSRRKRVVQKML